MTDYSEAEMAALQKVFPNTTVFLCDFHRKQDVTTSTVYPLLKLKNLIYFEHVPADDPGQNYLLSVKQLKQSPVWKNHQSVRMWLTNYWLPIQYVGKCSVKQLFFNPWNT